MKMTMEESTSAARRNLKHSRIAFLCAIFMVLMWIVLLFLTFLRIRSENIPIDYIVNATSIAYSSLIL